MLDMDIGPDILTKNLFLDAMLGIFSNPEIIYIFEIPIIQ